MESRSGQSVTTKFNLQFVVVGLKKDGFIIKP